MQFVISEEAAADIADITIYGILNFGNAQTDQYLGILRQRFQLLCDNPGIGRLDTRVNPAIRRFEFESHVIFYDVFEDHILIVRILHKSTEFIKHLQD